MSAEPQGAAEMEPSGWDFSGAGIPPVGTLIMVINKKVQRRQRCYWAERTKSHKLLGSVYFQKMFPIFISCFYF